MTEEGPFEFLKHAVALNKTAFIAFFLGLFAVLLLAIRSSNNENSSPTHQTHGTNELDHYGHAVPMMQNIGRHQH